MLVNFPAASRHWQRSGLSHVARQPGNRCCHSAARARPHVGHYLVGQYGIYATALDRSEAPVFRLLCGDVWFDIRVANRVTCDGLDTSQRRYRWLVNTLHWLDFPVLANHSALRRWLMLALRGVGSIFSLTDDGLDGAESVHRKIFLVDCQIFLVDRGTVALS